MLRKMTLTTMTTATGTPRIQLLSLYKEKGTRRMTLTTMTTATGTPRIQLLSLHMDKGIRMVIKTSQRYPASGQS